MTIKYLGHACFLFTDSSGLRVLIDPYEPRGFGGAIGYGPITDPADVVLVTHEHADHNYVRGVPGNPTVCRESCEVRGVEFRRVEVAHDEEGGRKRGEVGAFVFALDGATACHVGDLGNTLSAQQVAAIGPIEVLLIPVGGTYTVDATQAWAVVEQLKPQVVVPMHYRTAKVSLPLGSLDAFTRGKPKVVKTGATSWEYAPPAAGEGVRVVVLVPAN